MQTNDNKVVIHQWIDAWMRKDLAPIDQLFAPNYTVNGIHVGVEGVKQAVQFLHTAFTDISVEVNEMVTEGDKVVLRWTVRGKQQSEFMGVPPKGQLVELQGINIYRVADGKIAKNHEQTNILEVLQKLKSRD